MWTSDHDTDDLHETRLQVMTAHLLACGARTVLDLGCGPGELLVRLAVHRQFERIVGIDVSTAALAEAQSRLGGLPAADRERIEVLHASFAEGNPAFSGFDAGVLLETIEHVDPDRLSRVEQAVFGSFRPRAVFVTTPNAEYNPLHGLLPGRFRHPDHRFEWDRPRFRRWARGVAERNGYSVRFVDIGMADEVLGASTQMAIFDATD